MSKLCLEKENKIMIIMSPLVCYAVTLKPKRSCDCCGYANKFICALKNICTILYSISVQQICKLLYIEQYKLYTI